MGLADPDQHCCFVIQAVPPYHYDLNQILALPAGFRYHNRYDEQWIDPNVRDNTSQLIGRSLLIVMRDRDRNRLVPVRWARLVVAQPIGNIVYFEYLLGDLIAYGRKADEREANIDQYTRLLQRYRADLPGTAGKDLTTPSVFLSAVGRDRDLKTAPAADLSEWGNVVAAVATASIYEKVDFLKLVDISSADGRRPAKLTGELYEVAANTVYTLRVFQTMPNFGDGVVIPHDISLHTFPDHIASLRARQRAVGKYDMLTFVLKILDLPPNERTSIEVAHESTYQPGVYASGSLYVPLIVRPSGYLRPALRFVAAALALLLVFKPELVPADQQLVRSAANVAFVLLVAGADRTLQALWPAAPWR
jgi:hypothetical protein